MMAGGMEQTQERNDYTVAVEPPGAGWTVVVRDPQGSEAFTRACGTEEEARSFASTVQQHIDWLSPAKFRSYYRIPEPD